MRITRANARFQQWQALLGNRAKRQRAGELLIQGVRPISLVVEFGWPVHTLIYDAERPLSNWAEQMLKTAGGERVAMAPNLLRELGGKDEDIPELVAVAVLPDDELSRIQVGPSFLGVVFDRPNNPGNIGTMARLLDAFGGAGLIVTGHAAELDLTGPTLLVIGNETTGLSAGWRQACDTMARIPMAGSASSLNAASAATAVLYEAARQRHSHTA